MEWGKSGRSDSKSDKLRKAGRGRGEKDRERKN